MNDVADTTWDDRPQNRTSAIRFLEDDDEEEDDEKVGVQCSACLQQDTVGKISI